MKKLLFAALALCIGLSACKKEDTVEVEATPDEYATFKQDGKDQNFTISSGISNIYDRESNLLILGVSSGFANGLTLQIYENLDSLSFPATFDNLNNSMGVGLLVQGIDYSSLSLFEGSADTRITVTSFGNGYIEGTFNAAVYENADPAETKISLTNGKFRLKYTENDGFF